jgi:hypothetical protein
MPDPALTAALGALDPAYAGWLADSATTTVTPYPAPFLHRLQIVQVVYRTPYHALGFCAAWAPGEPALMLTDEPQNFLLAALADPVNLATPDLALAYLLAYLDTTRPANELVYFVSSPSDLRFYPNPNPAEQQRIDAFSARYAQIIVPPTARRLGDDWRVTAFLVRQQALEHTTATVSRAGLLDTHTEVLEGGLPVAFAARQT